MRRLRWQMKLKSGRYAHKLGREREAIFKRVAIRQCNRFIEGKDFESLWNRASGRAPKLPAAHEYIYGLVDPRNKRIRYIGRTRKPLVIRLSQHISTTDYGESYKQRWIRGLILKGYMPLIVSICIVPANLAPKIEDFVVRRLSRNFEPLVNTTAMKRYLRRLEWDVRKRMKYPMLPFHPFDHREIEVREEIDKRIEKLVFERRWPKVRF